MELTKASIPDVVEMRTMFEKMENDHLEILERCENGIGDKGYDDVKLISQLWVNYKIKSVINIRNMWKDGEETRTMKDGRYKNMTYDYKGTVFCHCGQTGEVRKMAFGGFENGKG